MPESPENRKKVLFISNVPWDFVWQRHQTLACLFANEHRLVFCEIPGVRRLGLKDLGRVISRLKALYKRPGAGPRSAADIPVLRPFVLPASNRLFCIINRWLLTRFVAKHHFLTEGVELIVTYSPSRSALFLLDLVSHKRLVYDCTDDWLAVRGIPSFLPQDERELMASADLTVVPSKVLLQRKAPHAKTCLQIPHGVLVDRFLLPEKAGSTTGGLTLAYYGHMHRQHLNFELIVSLALARPSWRIFLIGPVVTPHVFPSNVIVIPQQAHEALREQIAEADVLILPYILNEYTQAVMPAKSYECLATGRPVVATPLPELVRSFTGLMQFAAKPADWISTIEQAVSVDTPSLRLARIDVAKANSWESRYREFHAAIFS